MKRLILTSAILFFAVIHLSSQIQAFSFDSKVINLGTGIGSNLFRGTYYGTIIPPVSTSFEFGIHDHVLEKGVIGTGVYIAAGRYKYEYSRMGWETTNFIIGASGNFHYPLIEYLDTYTGVMFGYEFLSIKYFGGYDMDDYSGSSNGFAWAWYVGGRYYFSDKMAVLLETGYGVAYLTIGIAFKL